MGGEKRKTPVPDYGTRVKNAFHFVVPPTFGTAVPFVPSVAGRGPHPSPDLLRRRLPPFLSRPGFQPHGPVLCPPVYGVLMRPRRSSYTWNYIRNFPVRQGGSLGRRKPPFRRRAARKSGLSEHFLGISGVHYVPPVQIPPGQTLDQHFGGADIGGDGDVVLVTQAAI